MSSAESRESNSTKLTSYPRIPRNDLVVQDQLGCGSFGSVYRGIWRCDGKEQVVALKKVFMLEKEVVFHLSLYPITNLFLFLLG
jgi:hypothetical protein